MKRQKTAIAKRLLVTCLEDHVLDGEGLSQLERKYAVYQFDNGLVMVPGVHDRDWYFPSCDALAMAEGGTVTIESDGGEAAFDVGEILVDLWKSMGYYENYDCKELCSIEAWSA